MFPSTAMLMALRLVLMGHITIHSSVWPRKYATQNSITPVLYVLALFLGHDTLLECLNTIGLLGATKGTGEFHWMKSITVTYSANIGPGHDELRKAFTRTSLDPFLNL